GVRLKALAARHLPIFSGMLRRNPRWSWGVGALAVLCGTYWFGPDMAVMPVGIIMAALLAFWRPQYLRVTVKEVFFVIAVATIPVLAALILYWREGGVLAEPFRWVEGTSIWPAVIIR